MADKACIPSLALQESEVHKWCMIERERALAAHGGAMLGGPNSKFLGGRTKGVRSRKCMLDRDWTFASM